MNKLETKTKLTNNKLEMWKNQSFTDKVFDVFNTVVLALVTLICLYPLYYIVMVSFSSQVTGVYLYPKPFSLEAYKMVLGQKDIWIGYGNTIYYTVFGTLLSLAVTLPCAYALSRKDFVGRNIVTTLIMITMFISGGLIPGYLNMNNLGLVGSRWAIILSGLASSYNIIVSRTFFSTTIPVELLEASRIDGCSNEKFFVRIVLPLSKPIIAVIALYVGVGRWNSYFTEMIYLSDKAKFPLSLFLRRLLSNIKAMQVMISEGLIELDSAMGSMQMASVMQYCLIVVSTVPMMIIYPFLQKYFAKGVMIGSVKG